MLEEANRTRDKIYRFFCLFVFILSSFFWTYLWPSLRIMDDGFKSGQLRGYVSIKSINNGFISWYTGGPPFDPYSYALQNLIYPTLAIILFLLSLGKLLFTTSSIRRINLHTLEYCILGILLSVCFLGPYFFGHPQIVAKRVIEQSPNSSFHLNFSIKEQLQVSALLFRNGSDCELERSEGYFIINLSGTSVSSTYADAFQILTDGSQVQARLRLINCTNIDRLNSLQIRFDNDESSGIVISKGNITVEEGSFHLIQADTTAHLVVSQEVGTLDEPSLVVAEICFSPENWGSKIIFIQIT